MDIVVRFENGDWRIEPDPASVTVGTAVTWLLRSPRSNYTRLRWTVYFAHGTPFSSDEGPFCVTTVNTKLGTVLTQDASVLDSVKNAGVGLDHVVDHEGAIGPVAPTEPGQYKYGIKVENAETDEEVADDDPQLVILPR